MPDCNTPAAEEQVRALYEQAASRTADAFEELVSKPSVGVLLARSAENVAAIARIGSDFADLVPRNLRLAGRADVARLARQLHRTEDKLERLLLEEDGIGITVNTVAPGFIATEMLEHVPEKVLDGIKEKIPVGRLGRPDEIARVVHFLAGDQSSFITGATWDVNGGMDM
jgi:acetoacetyl-CoA reductase/3-oxoacyl-[acyl-carrier protein] reductase